MGDATQLDKAPVSLAIAPRLFHLSPMTRARTVDIEFIRPQPRRKRIARLDTIATILDTAFFIPGINVRFGVDSLIGIVPAIGDAVTTAMSLWLVHEAYHIGAPRRIIVRMLRNVVIDGWIGAVPIVGDVFDVMWRANRRNMHILRDWLEREGSIAGR